MNRVRAIADGTQPVNSGCVQAGCIAVRPAARTDLVQFEAKPVTGPFRTIPQFLVSWRWLHRRPSNAALNMKAHIRVCRLQRVNDVFDLVAGRDRRYPYIDHGFAVGCDHVGLDATVDRTNVDGNAALNVIE